MGGGGLTAGAGVGGVVGMGTTAVSDDKNGEVGCHINKWIDFHFSLFFL